MDALSPREGRVVVKDEPGDIRLEKAMISLIKTVHIGDMCVTLTHWSHVLAHFSMDMGTLVAVK